MTKERYFEMCEALGTQPVPSEIPVEFSDLPEELKQCLEIWQLLPEDVDSFAGVYKGRKLADIMTFLTLFDVPRADWRVYLILIHQINALQVDRYNKKKTNTALKASP